MRKFLLKRALGIFPVLWGVSTIVFLLIHLIPGDPVDIILGENALATDRAALRQSLNLDKPLPLQYGLFLKQVAQLDLGKSLYSREPVTAKLLQRFPATLELALAAMALALLISIPLGILSALYQHTPIDNGAVIFSLLGISLPSFWLGPLLIILFSVQLGWLPVSGREGATSLILPAVTLGLALSAILSRMIRSCMLEIIHEDFVRTARAKGLSPLAVTLKHHFRNALIPVITLLGLQFGALLTGAIIVEKVFGWPGMGSAIVEAVERRDYPVIQGGVLLISFSYVLVNLLTDMVYTWIDPRVRYEK